jgi:hypothetical protein
VPDDAVHDDKEARATGPPRLQAVFHYQNLPSPSPPLLVGLEQRARICAPRAWPWGVQGAVSVDLI